MHPWMLEQLASEHRRDLLSLGAHPSMRRPGRSSLRWRWFGTPPPALQGGPEPAAQPAKPAPSAAGEHAPALVCVR